MGVCLTFVVSNLEGAGLHTKRVLDEKLPEISDLQVSQLVKQNPSGVR